MSEDEYWDWRGKAKVALNYKLAEYRRLKSSVQLGRPSSRRPQVVPVLERSNPVEVADHLRQLTGGLYSVFLAVGAYIDDRSEDNLNVLAAIYERTATAVGSSSLDA